MSSLPTIPSAPTNKVIVAGVAYLLGSLAISALYLTILAHSAANDFWWRHFNTTGDQTYLADVFNSRALFQTTSSSFMSPAEPLDLVGEAMLKDYSGANTFVDTRPTSVRRWMLNALPLDVAVTTLRKNSLFESFYTVIPYCWVDFTRRFELAHTAGRQRRCDREYQTNAAVHLESLLRNVQTVDLLQSSVGSKFNQSIFASLYTLVGGADWMAAVTTHTWLSIPDEVQLWHAAGLTEYTIEYQNRFQYGVEDSVEVVNALGTPQTLSISSSHYVARGLSSWSTVRMNVGIWNDMNWCMYYGCSLVRQANRTLENIGLDWDLAYNGAVSSPGMMVVRAAIGPLMNWDSRWIRPPVVLLELVQSFQRTLRGQLKQKSNVASSFLGLGGVVAVDVEPPAWRTPSTAYLGGNPLCPIFPPKSFVQAPFSYDDSCQVQAPFVIPLDKVNAVFAMAMTMWQARELLPASNQTVNTTAAAANPTAICTQSPSNAGICTSALQNATALALALLDHTPEWLATPTQSTELVQLIQTIRAFNISFVQMAIQQGAFVLLTQSILDPPSSITSWSFFGWATLLDWVDGTREVLQIEGDRGRLNLLSDRMPTEPFAANPLELPRKACYYFWYIAVYITVLSGVVSVVCVAYTKQGFQGGYDGRHLFQYHRVFGSVWVGRPLLFVRGISALFMLATATPRLMSLPSGITFYQDDPRSFLERVVLSGEALWVEYVLVDLFLPWTTGHSAKISSPIASAVAFIGTLCLESIAPVQVQTTLDRNCVVISFRQGITCTSGVVQVGSFPRVCWLMGIQAGAFALAVVVTQLIRRSSSSVFPRQNSGKTTYHHALIPAAADAFLLPPATAIFSSEYWHLDPVMCILSGMVPFNQTYLFDLKLWIVTTRDPAIPSGQSFGSTLFAPTPQQITPGHRPPPMTKQKGVEFTSRHAWLGALSLVYMCGCIGGSYAFIQLTASAMDNDFFWAGFDINTLTHMTNLYSRGLQEEVDADTIDTSIVLTDPQHGALTGTINTTATTTLIPTLYATSIQDEANTLVNVITSLRHMENGCNVPWIMTSYCYVDFERRWEMGRTSNQQARCLSDETGNAAVYVEAFLRNVPWNTWTQCWGDAFATTLLAFLDTSIDGRKWVASTTAHATSPGSVLDELSVWTTKHGLNRYTTQWQNYKSLGIIESFSVQNAFGWRYPLTLKSSNGSLQLAVQTTFKMLWPFAVDLLMSSNNSGSLVRQAATYVYANTTVESFLVAAGIVPRPITSALALLQTTLGPLGTIHLKRIPCPKVLRVLHRDLSHRLTSLLAATRESQQRFWPIYSSFTWQVRPTAWDRFVLSGGSLMCDIWTSITVDDRPAMWFTSKGSCNAGLQEVLISDTLRVMMATVAVMGPTLDVFAVARREVTAPVANIALLLNQSVAFLRTFESTWQLDDWLRRAQVVQTTIRDEIHLDLVQFVRPRNPPTSAFALSQVRLFDGSDPHFNMFAWLYLFDWVQGIREVVTFQGDVGAITTLSTINSATEMHVNPMEVPLNVAFYMQWLLQYITFVMLGVAVVVCVYIVALKGQVEAANMLSFSRITSLVWIGRPLILLRAFCAICLLSTSTLQLVRPLDGLVAYFESIPTPWFTVVLTAGELNWMTFIVNDLFSVLTLHHTATYSGHSFVVVWISSVVWALASPIAPVATISRTCDVDALDFQLVCHGGLVEIGLVSRFGGLIGLVGGSCVVCYLVERIRQPLNQTTRTRSLVMEPLTDSSFFLYATAKHHFHTDKWGYDDVKYVDRASAVLTGILTVHWNGVLFAFDIKTWRVFGIQDRPRRDDDMPRHIATAMRLVG
ncbi:hypothetical protein DYB38_003056 [Aphanomyces astaci]|uniref:Transmembrane protein n=1 Tax=Aphanomyces astaci TaxID=112090 RepID=A0A397AR04_APHAT|nr:hypothetical protein DYB36_001317 [Aphanomyces astaci]RHY49051.1 hypothetical protein DYB38_003056 [Aphanomyces astaci]